MIDNDAVDTLLGVEDKAGEAPRQRVPTAKLAESIFEAYTRADETASRQRAAVDAMVDGEPPWAARKLIDNGQGDRCNLNFLGGAAAIEAARMSYLDVITSVEQLFDIRTSAGRDEIEAAEKSAAISEEYDWLNREAWGDFEVNFQLLTAAFVDHGLGVGYREDEINWQWQVAKVGEFKIHKDARIGERNIEAAFCERSFLTQELYKFVEDEQYAVHWDQAELRKAIMEASQDGGESTGNWEQVQLEHRTCDLEASGRARTVKAVHGWFKEFDGRVTHVLFRRTDNGDKFLYHHPSRFEQMSDCLVIFSLGVGRGTYGSIRGYGHRIFPFEQVINRLNCRTVDAVNLAGSVMIQPQNADDAQNMALAFLGPYAILPPEMDVVNWNAPNVARDLIPGIGHLNQMFQNNTGLFQSRGVDAAGQERTKFEVQAQLQRESQLSVGSLNLFYLPWTRLHRGSLKRLANPDYRSDHPGGDLAFEFYKRLKRRGVDREDLAKIYSVRPVRAIGNGSPGARLVALDQALTTISTLDDVGRNNLLRMRYRALGFNPDILVPKASASKRSTIDEKVAELENNSFQDGKPVRVMPSEPHVAHLRVHMPFQIELIRSVDAGETPPEAALAVLSVSYPHTLTHIQAIQDDKTRGAELGEIKKGVQQIEEVLNKITQRVQAQQRKQMESMQEEALAQQAGGGAPDPELQQKIFDHQMKMQHLEEEHQQRLRHRDEEFRQAQALRDIDKATKLSSESFVAPPRTTL